ncbi:MAG TPA: class I SAM-dependent methyltransferase [Alphaproteobacteria bacterium]|jgi:SAM-dependent methyltransferase
MERIEYERMHAVEDRMWWFRGLHANALAAYDAVRNKSARGTHGATRGAALVLDAGCGTGGLLSRLVALPGAPSLVGLDVDQRAAELARLKSGGAVTLGSVNALPFRENSFAAIFSMDVMCHRAVDPAAALREAERCLAPGGALILNLPAYPWLLSAHDVQVHNARRFTRPQLRGLLHAAGFPEVRISYWNMALFPLMVLRRKLLPSADGSDVQLYPAPVEALFRAVLAAERGIMRSGLTLPFGGSLIATAIKPETAQ